MKVHKVTLFIVDHDELGSDGVIDELTHTRYANDCINPHVISVETADCGEWTDEHPLNNFKTMFTEIENLFQKKD